MTPNDDLKQRYAGLKFLGATAALIALGCLYIKVFIWAWHVIEGMGW